MAWSKFGEFINNNRGPLGNLGTGLAMGWGTQGQRPGTYVPMSNWAGNGLAHSGLQYIPNYNYVNPFDALNAGFAQRGKSQQQQDANNDTRDRLINLFNKSNDRVQYRLQNVYGKLAGLGGNIGQFAKNRWGNIITRRFGNKGDLYVSLPNYNAYGETIA